MDWFGAGVVLDGLLVAFGVAGFAGGDATAATAFLVDVLADLFGVVLTAFLEVFRAADFFADFLTVFLAFVTARLPFLATRFVPGAFFVARAGEPFFVFLDFFFDDFFLAVATTDSFANQIGIVGIVVRRSVYRVASASSENTEKTSGLRSRL
ncbi:hypothetical protein [Bradyrhizobium lablabi]|uniref:hypothetical protein n=1 Tax=Bradyrhizobium lablabi TaxID=722472 RepID=UPI00289FE167|nr:hypothetical protein [Bradyrhizobium lablabi]